jgi:hypothetical protein
MQLLWDNDPNYGFIIEPADRMNQTLQTIDRLRTATTFGQLRGTQLPDWAKNLVDSQVEYHEVDLEEEVTDATPWPNDDVIESLVDAVPLPWDASSVTKWLDAGLFHQHATVSGASPAGNIDGYNVTNRDAFLAALEAAGHTTEHRPELADAFHQAL